MRIGVVINPVSGSRGRRARSGQDRAALARRFADGRRTIDLETVVTTAPGHAIELTRGFVARRFDLVIAWGGDGTANEVAGPLIGTTTALGIVAEGSGDGFARGLGLPREADAALAAAADRPGVPVDVGLFGARHFLNVAGVGFDAEVAHAFHAEGTRRGGLRYVRLGLQQAWSYRGKPYSLTLDGRHSDETFYLVAFANGREYGNGSILAPDADVSDGWLNVVILEDGPLWRQLWRARRMKFAVHRPARGIRRVLVQSATIEARHLRCQVDGEPFDAADAVDVRIAPGALRVAGRP